MEFPIDAVRSEFPALTRQVAGAQAVYLDGPAGSQVPLRVADAVRRYLLEQNANTHGSFVTSRETDALFTRAGEVFADFLGADDPQAIAFGPNMTTLTFHLSRALARTWSEGDEVIVTRLDHDANVTPWVLAARDAGVTVRHVPFHTEDTTLDLDALERSLSSRTRLVAVGAASNATGTLNPVARIAAMAHGVGAQIFVDAVHYAPHALIDVAAWDVDYVACSAYKFFGPHVGVLWGRPERMGELPTYRVRPQGDVLPDRLMTGTQCHEGIAGAVTAVDYLADLGVTVGSGAADRRGQLTDAFAAIGAHERALCDRLLAGLAELPQYRVFGIADRNRLAERAPTVSIRHATRTPEDVAGRLGEQGIFVWHGDHYAVDAATALGVAPEGMVRIGFLHYNTHEEVGRLLRALAVL